MFYYIHLRKLNIGEQFYIYNEQGQAVLNVLQTMSPVGLPQTAVLNMFGQELFAIRRPGNGFSQQCDLFQNGLHIASLMKDPYQSYIRTVCSFANITLEGYVLAHDYTILQNNGLIAKINRVYPYRDQYPLYIADSYPDHALLCTLSIAVDHCLYNY